MATSTVKTRTPLYMLLDQAHAHLARHGPALSKPERERLSQLLASTIWLQMFLDEYSDAIHLQLQGTFPQMGNILCAKGELQSALQAFLQNDYEGFEHHLAFAQQWYEWDREDTPQEPVRYI